MTATTTLRFCAAHRLLGHEGTCARLHGHNYVVRVMVEAEELDSVGRVADFSVVKRDVGGWLTATWDHAVVLNAGDPLGPVLEREGQKVAVLSGVNPTAEGMADFLFRFVCPMYFRSPVKVVEVEVEETPGNKARAWK